jgi:pSer/pThr/pTyr-binding forkhead associated (FHA) protein
MCTAPLETAEAKPKVNNPTIIMQAPRHLGPGRPAPIRLNEHSTAQTQTLALPINALIKIAVEEGVRPGTEHELSRPLMTIGRLGGGADIEVDDPEVSRLHCSVEVRSEAIFLQDLRSKNGTFIDGARVFAAQLEESSRFRIGSTVLRIDRTEI